VLEPGQEIGRRQRDDPLDARERREREIGETFGVPDQREDAPLPDVHLPDLDARGSHGLHEPATLFGGRIRGEYDQHRGRL
jgi:hypothetical protein